MILVLAEFSSKLRYCILAASGVNVGFVFLLLALGCVSAPWVNTGAFGFSSAPVSDSTKVVVIGDNDEIDWSGLLSAEGVIFETCVLLI